MTSHMVDKVCNTCQKGKKSKGAINCDWCGTRFASTNEEGCKKCILQLFVLHRLLSNVLATIFRRLPFDYSKI